MNFKIILNSRANKDGTSILYIQYFKNNKKQLLPIGLKIEKEFFDIKKGRVKKFHPKSEEYNLIIGKALSQINDIEIKAKLQNIELTPSLLESEFKNPSSGRDFYSWVINEIKNSDISEPTRKAYISIMSKINEYQPGVMFAEMDTKWIEKFDNWMKIKKKNSINTRANAHKRLKTYIKIAHEKKLIGKDPYKSYKIKKNNDSSRRVYLTFEERNSLIELYENGLIRDSEKKVLRGFLFSCFTGLRFSDMIRVKHSNIDNDILQIEMLKTKRSTGRIVVIPLIGYAKKLINDSDIVKYGNIFKSVSEQKTNKHLKALAKKVGINKKVTTHVGRHTFATLFWEKTKDIATLQRLLGHSNINETMIYAHVSKDILLEQMKKFEQ